MATFELAGAEYGQAAVTHPPDAAARTKTPKALPSIRNPACTLSERAAPAAPIPFRFDSVRQPFGAFYGGNIELIFASFGFRDEERARFALATSDNDGVVVRGIVRSVDLVLRPLRPLVLGSIVELRDNASVELSAAHGGQLSVAYRLQAQHDYVITPSVLRGTLDCSDVTLTRQVFEPTALAAGAVRRTARMA